MLKMTKNICEATALTHSGRFHADDVISAVILNKVYGNITLLRTTRVPEKMPSNVVVFDIGGGEYDHHQKVETGCETMGFHMQLLDSYGEDMDIFCLRIRLIQFICGMA